MVSEQLRARDRRLRLALEAGHFGDWEMDLATAAIARGPRFNQIFGLEGEGELSWADFLACVLKPDRETLVAALKASATGIHPPALEYRISRQSDQAIRWIRAYIDVDRDEAGAVSSLVGLVADVTQEHERSTALRQSEERYRLAAAAVSEAVWDWNLVTDEIDWTEQLRAGFGHDLADLRTNSHWWLDNIHPADLADIQKLTNSTLSGGGEHFRGEYRFRRGDGSYAHVLDRGLIVRDAEGAPIRMVGAMLDLSRRKAAEEALAGKEAQLRTILETVPIGIVMAELPSGRIIEGNSYVEKMLRHPVLHSPDIDSYDEWVSYHADGTRVAGHEYPLARMVMAGEETPEIEVLYQRGDGTQAWTRIMGRPVRSTDGTLVGGVVAMVDTDANYRAQEALQKLNQELEARVAEQLEARMKTEAALRHSQKLEAVGQLTGGIAHDFNNLLTVIMSSLEEIEEALDPDLRPVASAALAAADRGASLTSQLLSFARKQAQAPVLVAPGDLLSVIEGLVSRTLPDDVTLSVVGKSQPWNLFADPALLESAVLNLCLNSRDAMPRGGHLTIEAREIELTDSDIPPGEMVPPGIYGCIEVTDTGTGMDPETVRRATEPFYTTKEVGRGTGLGLSMSLGFAQQSGGLLLIRSGVGAGTTVSLCLPLGGPQQTPIYGVQPTAKPRTAAILLVEDNDLVRGQLARRLCAMGHKVTEARDASQALAEIDAGGDFDLLFTDVVMPGGVNGVELAEQARRHRPLLKVLFTTGYNEVTQRYGDELPGHLLRKPYREPELAGALAEVLGG